MLSPVVCQGRGEKGIQVVSKDVFAKDNFLELLFISSVIFNVFEIVYSIFRLIRECFARKIEAYIQACVFDHNFFA